MDRSRPLGGHTQPLFALAAAEVARRRGNGVAAGSAVSGLEETIVDLLQGRAFELYGEGLHQYVAIRLGDARDAARLLDELRAIVAAQGRTSLAQPPGMRARLYRLARDAVLRRAAGSPSVGAATLPWRRPRATSDKAYAGALRRMRVDALAPHDAELLELRFARELDLDEIAFVVDQPLEAVDDRIAAAEQAAHRVLDGVLPRSSDAFREALVEAFALDVGSLPPPATADAESATDRPPLPRGTVVGGRYSVDAHVGAGAFGDVYRALDTEVAGHVVALKLLHQEAISDEAKAEQLRELRIIASVFHPSVVQFKEFGWHERRLWFVMPWYDGETLEARLARKPLGRREARRIFEPLARALATMHAAGIRHQDVKPDNIFLARIRGFAQEGDETLPVLLDLGVAATDAEMLLAGTPTYFAPEVAHLYAFLPGAPEVGPKADVFSLALSLRNALEPESQDDVPAGALEAFIKRRATKGPALPTGKDLRFLRPHLRRWLAVDPDARPSADELAEELRVLTAPEERRDRRRAVLRWLVPAGLTVVSLFLAVTLWLGRQAREKEREAEEAAGRAQLFEARYEDAKKRFQEKALSSDELLRELAKAEARGDALDAELADTANSLELSRERRRSLTREVFDTNKRLATVRETLGETENELAAARDSLAARETELEARRAELDARTAELADARERLEDTAASLAARLREVERLNADVGRLETEVESGRDRAAALDARVGQLTAEAATLRDRATASQARIGRLEAELAEARAARDRALAELRARREEPPPAAPTPPESAPEGHPAPTP